MSTSPAAPRERAPMASGKSGAALEIGRLIGAFQRWLHLFLAIVVLTTVAVVAATLLIKPVYTATGRIRLDPNAAHASLTPDAASTNAAPDQAMVDTELAVIQSRSVMGDVVNDLNLQSDPEFAPPPGRDILDKIRKRLKVEREGATYVVAINFSSHSPQTAAKAANAFAADYIAESVRTRTSTASGAASQLNQQLTTLGGQVNAADAAVATYKAQNGIATSPGSEGTVTDQQIGPLSLQLATARSDAAAAESTARSARAQIAAGGLDSLSGTSTSPVIADLQTKRNTLLESQADTNSRYGPKHPQSIKLAEQIDQVNQQLRSEEQRYVSSLEAAASAADARAGKLQGELDGLKGEQATNMRASVQADSLQREADAKRAMYNQIAQSAQQSNQEQHNDQPTARVIEEAVPPSGPSFPNRILFALLGGLLGLLIGASVVVVLELTDQGVCTTDDVETGLGVPHIASIPLLTKQQLRNGGKRLLAWDFVSAKPMSRYAEVMRDIQNTVVQAGHGKASTVVAITSAVPAEGKTTCAVSLARVMAMSGSRVALVDCDLRRNALGKLVEPSPKGGLLEVLDGKVALDQALVADTTPGLTVLPLSKAIFTPRLVLGGEEMARLIAELSARFDIVVLDGPPILAVADARALAALADTVLVIARWRSTPRQGVRAALDRLEQDEAKIAGVALSQVDLKARGALQANDPAYYHEAYRAYYQE